MIVCRASFAALILLALGAAASAQTDPATPPPASDAPTAPAAGDTSAAPPASGAPTPLGGAATATPDQPAPDDAPVEFKPGMLSKGSQPGVTSGELGIVEGPPVGTLDDSNGGLGQSMWVNSSRGEVEELLGRVPLVSADPFVRGLAKRLVLTTSEAPVGPGRRALVTIRIEKLLQAGLPVEAGAIAAALRLDKDPDFARVQADALLYAGRDKDVCGDLTATRLSAVDQFWLELRTFCFAADGDTAETELTQSVMDSQGLKDAAFSLLMSDAMTGKKVAPKDIEHPTALHIYLLRKAGLPVTNAVAAKLGTVADLYAARDARNPAADRLSAAARISATGALSQAELLAILNAQTVAPDQTAQAPATAAKLTFLAAQSVLRRAATLESRPPEKADLLVASLAPGGRSDRLPLTAALQGDIAASVRPDPATAKARFLVARALLLQGRVDAAAAWYGTGSDDADSHAFQIMIDLESPSPARDLAAQAAYSWFAKSAAPQQNPAPIAALALGFSDVLGRAMPPEAKALAGTLEGMPWPGHRPAPDEVRKLAEAASQPGRRGEAVLRVLDIIGTDGPADLPPDVAIECVRSLQTIGLGDEARALSVEALALARP
jgi:hypothetical protein